MGGGVVKQSPGDSSCGPALGSGLYMELPLVEMGEGGHVTGGSGFQPLLPGQLGPGGGA